MTSLDLLENDEQFSGTELDEPGDDEPATIQDQEDPKSPRKKSRGKRQLLWIAIALSLLTGTGYFYLEGLFSQREEMSPANRSDIPKDHEIIFDSFVIPLKGSKNFTYISLSFSFSLPKEELRREMIRKKTELRGVIYDILRENKDKIEEAPALDKLKERILKRVNRILSSGEVEEVYITHFSAV